MLFRLAPSSMTLDNTELL